MTVREAFRQMRGAEWAAGRMPDLLRVLDAPEQVHALRVSVSPRVYVDVGPLGTLADDAAFRELRAKVEAAKGSLVRNAYAYWYRPDIDL